MAQEIVTDLDSDRLAGRKWAVEIEIDLWNNKERVCEGGSEWVCVCVCVCGSEWVASERVCVREWEGQRESVCVCARARVCEGVGEGVCVRVWGSD